MLLLVTVACGLYVVSAQTENYVCARIQVTKDITARLALENMTEYTCRGNDINKLIMAVRVAILD